VVVDRRAAFSAIISISELVRCNPFGVSFLASTADEYQYIDHGHREVGRGRTCSVRFLLLDIP
jgi:hypothetical protein